MSDNPYAPPGEGRPLPVGPPPAPTRRVEFRGTIQFDDVWQPPAALTPAALTLLVMVLALVMAVPNLLGVENDDLFEEDNWLWRAPIYGGGALLAVAMVIGLVRMGRVAERERVRRLFQPEDVAGWFASEAIELSASGMRQTLGWQAFTGYDVSTSGEPILWLLRPGGVTALPMPRRFFRGEDDWRRFEGLVAGRLPRGGKGAKAQNLSRPPLPHVENGIPFSGTIQGRHLVRARRLLGAALPSRLPMLSLVLLALAATVYMIWTVGAFITAPVVIGMAAAVVVCLWWTPRSEKIELHGVVEEGGIRVVEPLAETWFDWKSYPAYRRDERPTPMAVLTLPENRIHVFPREVFASDDDWQAFLARVEQHVPQAP